MTRSREDALTRQNACAGVVHASLPGAAELRSFKTRPRAPML
jgi:hypothetical protein